MYQRLVQYKREHGHCLVPRKYDADPKLSTWVETQRVLWNRDYRKKNPKEAVEAATGTYFLPFMFVFRCNKLHFRFLR